jgi:hypothetical protein
MNFIVASTGNITLKIDPAVVLATREYVDTRIVEELNKLDSKQSVRVATTANIVLAGLQSIDGVALAAGDRVLVKNQVVAKDNGIWLVAALAWKRAADADSNAEVTSALLTSVEQGTTQADTRWQLITDGAIVVGTTALTFQNVTQGFAPLNSPAFLGTPTVPTPAPFDVGKLAVNSEFVKQALGSYSGFSPLNASRSLTLADVGRALWPSVAGLTLTLPTPTSLGIPGGAGVALTIFCSSAGLTLAAGVGAVINNSLSTFVMKSGQSLTLLAVAGSGWQIMNSTADLGVNADFASLLGATFSSQQLPGLSIKVGSVSNASTATSIPLTLPVAFPVACVALIFTTANGLPAAYPHQGKDRTGATVLRGANANYQFDYVAVGY